MRSAEIFDLGYAIPAYDILENVRIWRYRGEEVTLPAGAVMTHKIPELNFDVAKWEDVKRAAQADSRLHRN